ncbi:MAG: hypothetical protein MR580_10760 [Anaerolactibacter massiliensis]|nr:hypothetical protein [Anaerolactibacter massiliensis]
MAERGRKKVNPDYNPVKARNEMAEAAAQVYLHPEADMETDRNGKASMKAMKEYFGLTMTKIRKLLVTAGVYSFEKDGKDMVQEVQRLKSEGLSAEEISKKLSCSIGTVNSFLPYESGIYHADFTADGYDFANVSAEARRKRNQRKREKMKNTALIKEKEKEVNQMIDRRTYMDRCNDTRKEEIRKHQAQSDQWLREHGFSRKMSFMEIEAKLKKEMKAGTVSIDTFPWFADSYREELKKNGKFPLGSMSMTIFEAAHGYYYDEPEERSHQNISNLGTKFSSSRYLHGKPIGDYLFLPEKGTMYVKQDDHTIMPADENMCGVMDEYHIPHMFLVTCFDAGGLRHYEMEEIYRCGKTGKILANQPDTHFTFFVMGTSENDPYLVHEVIEKTAVGLQNLTLQRKKNRNWASSVYSDETYGYFSKAVGRFEVEENGHGIRMLVDGKEYSSDDFVKLFSGFEGFSINYQIADRTEPIVESDMTLLPVRIDEDTLGDELYDLLFAMTQNHDGKFLSCKDVSAFDVLFEKLIKKLNYYYHSNPSNMGKDAGNRLIQILKEVGTDDELFPEYEIKMVKQVIESA